MYVVRPYNAISMSQHSGIETRKEYSENVLLKTKCGVNFLNHKVTPGYKNIVSITMAMCICDCWGATYNIAIIKCFVKWKCDLWVLICLGKWSTSMLIQTLVTIALWLTPGIAHRTRGVHRTHTPCKCLWDRVLQLFIFCRQCYTRGLIASH